ncbi:MAG: ComEC/Rec2 family competence protein [Dinoroseobacter sp.]|nr:ComEC/Rec2 family competence protein [Dinoroseobacter sp.]
MNHETDLRRVLFPWLPVLYGLGVLVYFSVVSEPPVWAGASALALGCAALLVGVAGPWRLRPVGLALCMVSAGFGLAAERTGRVSAPVLDYRYYGPIEGRLVEIDRSYAGAVRLTLDQVRLSRLAPRDTPQRVRVSLHGPPGDLVFEPGQLLMTTGHLSPPAAPAEPGGFDFRRHAWFERLGGVGYTRVPVLLWAEPDKVGAALTVYRFRYALSSGIRDRIAGQPGAFAAAILTGDRSGIDRDRVDDLRATNLAHLLAISGLHMGLLTGTVFLVLRSAIALVPAFALRVPEKKLAAVGALCAASAYLVISGAAVATERAFIMVSMMLLAVLVDRRAISLRSVAWAALIVLILRPEALVGPGFQMSFAATTALVVAFNAIRHWPPWKALPRWGRGPASLFLSSFVAGAATAPIAAAHFNIFAHYGLIANLASVPVMGMVVMPGALLALALLPVGAEGLGLMATDYGIRWILGVAGTIAEWDGAVGHVPRPPGAVLGLILAGGLLAALGPVKSLRLAGVIPVVLALGLWITVERPPLLVSESGGLLGLMTEQGRVLSRPKGEGFSARVWLENDGDGADQTEAAERPGLRQIDRAELHLTLEDQRIIQLRGKTGAARYAGACGRADLVILNTEVSARAGCRSLDVSRLRKTGAVAIAVDDAGLHITTARTQTGARLWSGAPARVDLWTYLVRGGAGAARAGL